MYLRTYLHYIVFLLLLQKFSQATFARVGLGLHCIIQLKMQGCSVTLPTPVMFYCIFGVIIPDSRLQKCTKTRLKWHKIAYKTPKHHFGWPRWGHSWRFPRPSSRLALPSLHVQCPLPEKNDFLNRRCIKHDASANSSNSTKSDIAQNDAILLKIARKIHKTRWAGQSSTWGRPASQVRVQINLGPR